MSKMSEMEALSYEVFPFLDQLRDRGRVNMTAAAPFVQASFDVSASEAQFLVKNWVRGNAARAGLGAVKPFDLSPA